MTYQLPLSPGVLQSPRAAEDTPLFTRYNRLTMPTGALDPLMRPTLKILAQRKSSSPAPLQVGFLLFAGDHSVARKYGVSAYPPEVTPQMVANIVSGGAAVSQLCARRGARLLVCDAGVAAGFEKLLSTRPVENVFFRSENLHQRFPAQGFESGARDFTQTSALGDEAHAHCWHAGARSVDALLEKSPCDVIALGEMGIGNTTAATAIAAVLMQASPEHCVGRGTGINDEALKSKTDVIQKGIERARAGLTEHDERTLPWAHKLLQELGGAELSAMAGAAWRAAERGVMVLLDGMIVTAAIAPFARADKSLAEWLLASHESAEHVHGMLLGQLGLRPFLKLGLRLGEGSGAAFVAGLLQDADALLQNMATFESAGVSSN